MRATFENRLHGPFGPYYVGVLLDGRPQQAVWFCDADSSPEDQAHHHHSAEAAISCAFKERAVRTT